jgi:hypothetical protein
MTFEKLYESSLLKESSTLHQVYSHINAALELLDTEFDAAAVEAIAPILEEAASVAKEYII